MSRAISVRSCLVVMFAVATLGEAAETEATIAEIRATEQRRLHALVAGDVAAARELHADDFQLINPRGGVLDREAYLGAIATGAINYLVWEPETTIEVRVRDDLAVIRYRSRLEIIVQGMPSPLGRFWHTDTYEKRDGRWQVVWSQATEVPSNATPDAASSPLNPPAHPAP